MANIKLKWKELNQGQKKAILAVACLWLVLLVVVLLVPLREDLSLRVEYSRVGGYKTEFLSQLFWDVGNGYVEENSSKQIVEHNRVVFPVDSLAEGIKRLRLDPMSETTTAKISSVWILNHGVAVVNIPVRDILEYAYFGNISSVKIEKAALRIEAATGDPMIEMDTPFIAQYFAGVNVRLKVMVCMWLTVVCVLVLCVVRYRDTVQKCLDMLYGNIDVIMRMLLVQVTLLVLVMAFGSFDYAHPDENVSRSAVEYYVNHWAPADIRSPEAADSFSEYGFSRLSEETIYYYLAGKVAWIGENILGLTKYYRLFNACLFLALVGLCFKKGKTNRYLYMLVGMSPQIWYLYCYCTSDAWDYFLSVLITYQILNRESMLHRALAEKGYRWKWLALTLTGCLFGALYLGKTNYLAVFLIAFLVLWVKLIETSKEERMKLLLRYATIVLVFAVWAVGSKVFRDVKYDSSLGEISAQLRQEYAWDAYKIDENGQREYAGADLRGRGVTLKELFTDYHFGKETFRSYAGYYGWMEYPGADGFYRAFYLCYGIVALLWLAQIIKNRLKPGRYIFLLIMNSVILAIFGASVWHSWTGDLQAQGRYLMPANPVFAVNEGEMRDDSIYVKITCVVLTFIVLLGMYSFVCYGISALT